MKRNLFIVGSPWHAVIAMALTETMSATCVNEYVLEYSTGATREGIEKVVDKSMVKVVEVDWNNFLLPGVFKKSVLNFDPFLLRSNLSILRKRFIQNESAYDTVYVFNLDSPISRVLVDLLNTKEIIKIEDGICDYLPFRFYGELNFVGRLVRTIYLHANSSQRIYRYRSPQYYLRAKSALMFFPERYSLVPNVQDLTHYMDSIKRVLIGDEISSNSRTESDETCLFIGQTLCEDKACSFETEIKIYLDAFSKILSSGMARKIIFKPHPRSSKAKYEHIEEGARRKKIDLELVSKAIPVETMMVKDRYAMIVGMWSNPVIYARKLFGVPSFSLMHEVCCGTSKMNVSRTLKEIHSYLASNFEADYRAL